ncbi:DUF222 domain-containing protein [Brachybacterium ginsengisoli]|uniref:DUF222 domain-containing protein n=1 Tax=Brachybacterium ginsengisoli TaxID=1331682 RepID=UPI001D132006|nr:HNH endonuclease signature motif containing protein [Brachybacterium ginsengisoli]
MAHDPHSERAERWEASQRSPGSAPREAGSGEAGGARDGAGAAMSGPRRSTPLRIEAGDGALRIGESDVSATRAVLAELGAHGATALDHQTPTEAIALLAQLQDLSGAIAAVQARALVRLESAVVEDCRRREETPEQARRIARSEASKAMKQSTACAGRSLSSCRRLVRSMPGMLGALAEGKVLSTSAHQVARTLGPATPEQRTLVDQVLTAHLPHLEGCGPQEWAGEAEKVLHGLDPRGAADRHRTATKDRCVTVRRGEHGMCTLTARLSGLDGARIRKGLSLAAERSRAQGDRRGHQQIMADLLADALIGRGEGIDPSTLEIGVIITDRSLLAPDHADAATIEGYGPVPYEHIRQEMLEAMSPAEEDPELAMTLRTLYTDATDGQLVAAGSAARSFPPALARFLRLAHQTCRAPYCEANIRQSDHIVPWSEGGPTALDNGNGLCAADNQKEQAGESVRVLHDENGVRRSVEWMSRYGQTARRRGINFDPIGTAAGILDRAARTGAMADGLGVEIDELGPASSAVSSATGSPRTPEQKPPSEERPRTRDRVLELVGSYSAAPVGGAEHRHRPPQRNDHVFFPHLTLVVDTPWRGPEPSRSGDDPVGGSSVRNGAA